MDQVWRPKRLPWKKIWCKSRKSVGKKVKKTGLKDPRANKKHEFANGQTKASRCRHQAGAASGHAGPICYCVKTGSMVAKQFDEHNWRKKGRSFVVVSGTKPHYLTASTPMDMCEQCYSIAFERQRTFLGVPANTLGAVLCDA